MNVLLVVNMTGDMVEGDVENGWDLLHLYVWSWSRHIVLYLAMRYHWRWTCEFAGQKDGRLHLSGSDSALD